VYTSLDKRSLSNVVSRGLSYPFKPDACLPAVYLFAASNSYFVLRGADCRTCQRKERSVTLVPDQGRSDTPLHATQASKHLCTVSRRRE
jgi:hypothetical protein